ncbi:MAG: LysM peptidoglycan-binding domain-containing protein [Pseudomonadota bacterium]
MKIQNNETPDAGPGEEDGFSIHKPLDRELKTGPSLLKKNELVLILVGAALVTILAFFIFTKPSDKSSTETMGKAEAMAIDDLNARIAHLEKLVTELKTMPGSRDVGPQSSLDAYQARLERIEAALAMKSDSLTRRFDSLESRFSSLVKTTEQQPAPKTTAPTLPEKQVKPEVKPGPAPVPASAPPKETKAQAAVHVVGKGDTLYGIARKYKTSVPAILKLNGLSDKDSIHPGDRLSVGP